MKLAVSSIAWTNEEEADVAAKLKELGVKYVELAPTKLWDDPTLARKVAIEKYKKFWRGYGIEIVAFQSMLFSRPDLKLFESTANRKQTLQYLKGFTRLAGDMGAGVLVFGSPKNRQRGELAEAKALTIATGFFNSLGDEATKAGVSFCIEPNPTDYACDFITNAQAGIDLVTSIANPGFGLHLDIAGMALAKDGMAASIKKAAKVLRHFHISSPFLEPVELRDDVKHAKAASALKAIGYDKFVSIEMRPAEAGQNVARVETAVKFAQKTYS